MSVDKEKLVERFVRYDAIDNEIAECKAKVDKLLQERSQTVELILHANDGGKRLVRKGKEMLIVSRGNTFFFKGKTEHKDITEIE